MQTGSNVLQVAHTCTSILGKNFASKFLYKEMNPKLLILLLLFGAIFFQSKYFNRTLKMAPALTPPILSHPMGPIQPVLFPELNCNDHIAQ